MIFEPEAPSKKLDRTYRELPNIYSVKEKTATGLFMPKSITNERRKLFIIVLLITLCCGLLLTGCGGDRDDPRTAKPEEFTGIWKPTELYLGKDPLDLSNDSFSIELNDNMTGTLSTSTETQDVKWEIRGFKGEYTDVRIVVTLENSFSLGGVKVDPKSCFNFIYSTEDKSLSFESTWLEKNNGFDIRFTLSGILKKIEM